MAGSWTLNIVLTHSHPRSLVDIVFMAQCYSTCCIIWSFWKALLFAFTWFQIISPWRMMVVGICTLESQLFLTLVIGIRLIWFSFSGNFWDVIMNLSWWNRVTPRYSFWISFDFLNSRHVNVKLLFLSAVEGRVWDLFCRINPVQIQHLYRIYLR